MIKFYSCRCFYRKNIFVKKYKIHFAYENDEQFRNDYKSVLDKLQASEVSELMEEVYNEISRRKKIEEDSLIRRKTIQTAYRPLNSRIFSLQKDFFHPSFLNLAENAKQSVSKDDILPMLDVISKGIPFYSLDKQLYGFPVFTEEFCEALVAELEHFESTSLPKGRPNSMNRYGTLLDELGFYEGFMDPLRLEYLSPLARLLYSEWYGDSGLDSQRAFTVFYEMGKDEDIDCHYDNAEVTLNTCLGKTFSGGELYFNGMRTDPSCEPSYEVVPHKIGYGIMHRGQQFHGTMPITRGERHNLIIWMRSSSVRNKKCPMCDQKPELVPSCGYGDGFTLNENNSSERCSVT